MKKKLLYVFLLLKLCMNAQVSNLFIHCGKKGACLDKMKNVTVHVLIKDFCDDSKPYKKILQDNWKFSKLQFDYSPAYSEMLPTIKSLVKDEWYMILNKYTLVNGVPTYLSFYPSFLNTSISVVKAAGEFEYPYEKAIEIPLFYPVHDKFTKQMKFGQDLDVAASFPNLANPFYLKNIIQVIEQLAKADKSYLSEIKPDCKLIEEVLDSTLYIPDYVLLKPAEESPDKYAYADTAFYLKGYLSKNKLVTKAEMTALFNTNKPFYYVLKALEAKAMFTLILEGSTGKIINYTLENAKYMDDRPMSDLYKDLKKKSCKGKKKE